MSRKILISILMLCSILLSACVTPYGPSGIGGGYKDRQIGKNEYIVSFFGNGNTSGQMVWNYWIYRCAELTLEKGFEFFVLLPSDEHAFWQSPKDGDLVVFSMLGEKEIDVNEKPRLTPAYYTYTTVTTYSSKAIVKMFNKPVPKETGILLDAGTIKDQLSPYVLSNGKKAPPVKKDLYVRAAVEAAIRANRIKRNQADTLRKMLELKI